MISTRVMTGNSELVNEHLMCVYIIKHVEHCYMIFHDFDFVVASAHVVGGAS